MGASSRATAVPMTRDYKPLAPGFRERGERERERERERETLQYLWRAIVEFLPS